MKPIFLVDNSGILLSANDALTELVGYNSKELVGQTLFSMMVGEAAEQGRLAATLLSGQNVENARLLLRTKDGVELVVTISASPLLNANGHVQSIHCTITETSIHQQFKPVDNQELAILRATLESTADGILVIDKNFQVVTCNRKFEEIWGLPQGWAALPEYKNLLQTLKQRVKEPEAFAKRVQEIYRQKVDTGYELIEMLDGRVIERFSAVYFVGGEIGGRVWNYRDRTERERAQFELNTLKGIAESLNRAVAPDTAVKNALEAAVRSASAQAGWICAIDEAGQARLRMAIDRAAAGRADTRTRPGRLSCECSLSSSHGESVPAKTQPCKYLERWGDGAIPPGKTIQVPIRVSGHAVGILNLLMPAEYTGSEADVRLFRSISDQFGVALARAELFNELQILAITDPLTGLYNRRQLFRLGEDELARAHRYHHPLSVLLLDVDHFKQVNDRFSHAIGDRVLREIAERFRAQARAADVIARFGGEEFVMLAPKTNCDGAVKAAERLRARIAQRPVETEKGPVRVTVSIGVSTLDLQQPSGELGA